MRNSALQRSSAGRKPGAITKVTRRRAQELSMSGEAPIDVMLGNMLFWHHHANEVAQQIQSIVIENGDPEQTTAAIKLIRELIEARHNSQECARDAAPYCHAKIHSILPMPKRLEMIDGSEVPNDPLEASQVYQKVIGGW
jgi:hypothetical protein